MLNDVQRIIETLSVPAAEYVPAIGEALTLLQELADRAARPCAVPAGPMVAVLDEEMSLLLRQTADDGDGGAAPIRLEVGDGHSGWGLYVSLAEYPEEGSIQLVELPAPQQASQLIAGTEVVSEPGAAIKVSAIHLTDEGRQMLTSNVKSIPEAQQAQEPMPKVRQVLIERGKSIDDLHYEVAEIRSVALDALGFTVVIASPAQAAAPSRIIRALKAALSTADYHGEEDVSDEDQAAAQAWVEALGAQAVESETAKLREELQSMTEQRDHWLARRTEWRRRAEAAEAALGEVCLVLETNTTAIVDTVWMSTGAPETLLDHCRVVLAAARTAAPGREGA